MSIFAQIENNIVTQVIVADQEFIDSGSVGEPNSWIEYTEERKNYPGIGYTYDKEKDSFISIQPFESWILNEKTCTWKPPISMPKDGKMYEWDEGGKKWLISIND